MHPHTASNNDELDVNVDVNVNVSALQYWGSASSTVMTSSSAIILSFLGSVALARLLYRSSGGGDGDDARHFAARVIVTCNPVSLLVFPIWALFIIIETPSAFYTWIWLPILCFIKDAWVYRERVFSAPMHGTTNNTHTNNRNGRNNDYGGIIFGIVDANDGRRTFFQELTCVALDILSRSLRRQSFYRVINILLSLQLIILLIWRHVFYVSLEIASSHSEGRSPFLKIIPLFVLFGGKWATGIITRILGLIASGGVTAWFAQQSILIEEMERMKTTSTINNDNNNHNNILNSGSDDDDDDDEGYDSASDDYSVGYGNRNGNNTTTKNSNVNKVTKDSAGNAAARAALHSMPKAYRSADANAYKPVIDFDDGMDDDYDEDENFNGNHNHNNNNIKRSLIMRKDGRGLGID